MRRMLLGIALLAGFADPVRAGDLIVGAETDMRFDDNVFGSSSNEVSDGYWTIAPTFELTERWKTVEGRLNLWPTYELYFDEEALRGINYDANGSLEWKPTERTTVGFSDIFRRNRTVSAFNDAGAVTGRRERFNRNTAEFSVAHRTSPRGTLYLNGSHALWEFDTTRRVDQQSGAAALRYDWLVNERARLGGSVQFSRQKLEPEASRSNHTDYFNASFTGSYVPAESFLFRASVGPTLVRQPGASSRFPSAVFRGNVQRFNGAGVPLVGIVGTCPQLPGGEVFDGPGCVFVPWSLDPAFLRLGTAIPVVSSVPTPERNSWTYFADVELSKEWENARLTGAYRRDQGSSSALGFTSISDSVSLSASWRPLQRLSLYVTTAWEDRDQADRAAAQLSFVTLLDTLPPAGTLPPVNNLVPTELRIVPAISGKRATVSNVSVSVGGDYFLHPALKLEAQAGWNDQAASANSGFGDASRFWLRVGLDFEYGPIRW